MKIKLLAICILSITILSGCSMNDVVSLNQNIKSDDVISLDQEVKKNLFHFSDLNSKFTFSAIIPDGLEVEYVPAIESFNIYDPNSSETSVRDKSQIFIRYFSANRFLTLSTVDILNRREGTVLGRPAVFYEIEKKSGVANFSNQPLWRNEKHKLVDIRFSDNSPSNFFVYSFNPQFSEDKFNEFISSIKFHNNSASFVYPMDRVDERVSKKPFGLYVTPDSSPVQPERFSGYHTAIDFEVFEDEINKDVQVMSVCGGKIESIRTISGYGGVVVQNCFLNNETIKVLYGHIDINTAKNKVGDYLAPGSQFISLSQEYSSASGGERKHLHLGIYKGQSIDIRGYVTDKQDLNFWIDPATILN